MLGNLESDEKVSPKSDEGKEGVTVWDKSCCRDEEGEDGP